MYQLHGSLESLDAITPVLWDAGCLGLEERGDMLIAYFKARQELPLNGAWLEGDDTDWLEVYRQSLRPVRIGRILINPGWDLSLESTGDALVIDLEPGLAFGTGQHETTRLAIEALQGLDLNGKQVLDVGAGSGILGMVADKLGARVIGVDNDASTVPVAQENARRNASSAVFLHGTLEDVLSGRLEGQSVPTQGFEVVVANLYAELHDHLMAQYQTALSAGGRLVMTGIMAGQGQADAGERVTWDSSSGRENLVMAALEREGLRFLRRAQAGDWVLLEAGKP